MSRLQRRIKELAIRQHRLMMAASGMDRQFRNACRLYRKKVAAVSKARRRGEDVDN